MGIAKVNGQKAWPEGGYPPDKPGCGCNSRGNPFITVDSYVPLNLQTYAQYLKTVKPRVMPRHTPAKPTLPIWIRPASGYGNW